MSDEIIEPDTDDLQRRMDGAIASLRTEFASLRTGRASASMLEPVMVDAYGAPTPINQIGTVNVPEPRMVTVNVWDKGLVGKAEKAIRESGLGTLIGRRTWGGLIGISANPGLMDGGTLTVPFFRFFDTNGRYTIENEGVAPDIRVDLDPFAADRGQDTQLDAAIATVLQQLETAESPVRPAPPYPTEIGK